MTFSRSVVCGVLVAVLAGCSSGSPTPDGSSSATLSGSIRVQLSGGDGEIASFRDLVTAFLSAHPGTKVEVVPFANAGQSLARLTTAFAAGNPPDVFLINYRRLGPLLGRNVIDPVTSLDTAAYYPAALEAFTQDGQLLCLPQNASSMVVYVNTGLFGTAGVALPKAGWTWGDLRTTAKALKAKGATAIGFETALIRVAPFVWSNGGEIVDDPNRPTRVTLGSAAAREAMQLLLELQSYGMSATDRAATAPEEAFLQGKVAMLLESRRAVPSLRKTSDLAFDVVGVPKAKNSVSVLHSDGYCVAKASKNLALAREFARYAVSTKGATVLARTGRTVPSLRSLAESPAFLDPAKLPASSRVFLDALPTVRRLPNVAGWNEAEEAAEDVLTQLFAGRLSLDAAIREIETRTAREFAKA